MTQAMKEQSGQCPICTEHRPLTKDHVPPKGLFLKPRPTNTITVFTCSACNTGSALDDEYFRIYIASTADPQSHLMQLWREKVVGSSLKRSPALQAALVEDMDLIREHHKTTPLTTYDGRPLTDAEIENVLPFSKARIDRIASKIVRCLHFHHTRSVLPLDAAVTVTTEPLTPAEIDAVVQQRSGLVGGKLGEFIYRYTSPAHGTWDWVLFFYLTHHFRVHVSQP